MKDHTEALDRAVRLKGSRKRIGRLILKDRAAADMLLPEVGGRVYLREDNRMVFQELNPEEMKYYAWLGKFLAGKGGFLPKLIQGVEEDLESEKTTKRKHRIYRDVALLADLRRAEKGERIGIKTLERNYRRMLSTSYSPPSNAERGSVGEHVANFHLHGCGTDFTLADFDFSREKNKGEVLISYKFRRRGRDLYYATVRYFCGDEPKKLATFHSFGELFL